MKVKWMEKLTFVKVIIYSKKATKHKKHDKMQSVWAQNRDQPEVRLCVGTFQVDVLAHIASRISSSPSWLVYPAVFTSSFYRILVLISTKRQHNVSLRNRQMSLSGQKCRWNLPGWRQYGVKMAYWWGILDMRIEEKWTSFHKVFTRVGLLVDLYSVLRPKAFCHVFCALLLFLSKW